MATERNDARSLLATVVGYLIVVIVGLILVRFVVGVFFGLFRAFLVVVVLLVLLTIYLRLKARD